MTIACAKVRFIADNTKYRAELFGRQRKYVNLCTWKPRMMKAVTALNNHKTWGADWHFSFVAGRMNSVPK